LTTVIYNQYMEKYVSNFSAARLWNIPCIDTVLGTGSLQSEQIDFTVFDQGARFRSNGKRVHSCELPLPVGAIVSRNGQMISSPELLFLELATKLSLHRLILLGLQLCSHKQGDPSKAITSKEKIAAFLAKTPGHMGHKKAMRAVKYISNGSASIMESITYMILTLPHSLGGYGLDGALFNYEIKLTREAQKRLKQKRCFADLYYKQDKLAVEYDSFAYHSSPAEQGKDDIRAATLERLGINVMHFSTIQLYNKEACRDFAYNLAARLNKRIRIRTSKFDEHHSLLRNLLPEGQSLPMPDNQQQQQ